MKTGNTLLFLGLAAVLAGCATSSQVQEMIDASHQDYLTKAESHDASIEVLKKSAMTGLEKSKTNGEALASLEVQLGDIITQLKIIKGYAEASKVMSAANTVKVADLDVQVQKNTEADAAAMELLMKFDKLYEGVMIAHYQTIADSANAAIESLKNGGWHSTSNAPVNLDEPIEILAPDTSATGINTPVAE
ncbi:hypothetical protein PDESU_05432 [Pontiella desulfatans]|uniref:DUF4142 domain-containing protein n=1 Tax=Pontiella desulfatans TaxID=2750659 RepID=A0A6C2U9X3_PONDE|nr:hypothetical protein [Pontiella desulfatans]VGO16840.1 hypothetical protein PDESU_05432 [Pontiella desulfatans]